MRTIRAWPFIILGMLLIRDGARAQISWVPTETHRASRTSALLERPARLEVHDATLVEALTRLSQTSGVLVAFSPSAVAQEVRRVNCDCRAVNVGQALDHLLGSTAFGYRELRGEILVGQSDPEPALRLPYRDVTMLAARPVETSWSRWEPSQQQGIVTGMVTEAGTLRPLAAALVQIAGTQLGGLTTSDGRFEIVDVPSGEIEVQVRLLGYATGTQQVTVPSGGTVTVNFQLAPDALALDEVVAIGYGQQRRANITGAVGSVEGEQIRTVTSSGLQEALQGRLAGVNITPTSGMPGGALDMNIRGVATFGSGNPLFVIDGFPVLSEGESVNFNPLANLSPENIESIQIFKDASASAIYGTRAANGVVMITTNRGANRPPQVQFKSSTGVSRVTDFIPMMTTEQFVQFSSEAFTNAGRPVPVAFQEPLLSQNLQRNTDWQREAFSPAVTQNYWLGVTGGSDALTYSLSGSHLDQDGTLPQSGFKRSSLRINSDLSVGSNLRIGESLELSRAQWTGVFGQTGVTTTQLIQQSPTVPVRDPESEGGFDGPRLEYGPVGRQNSIGAMSLDENRRTLDQVLASGYAEYEFLPGLSNRFNVGAEVTLGETFAFFPTFRMGDRNRNLASLQEGRSSQNVYLLENTTTFQRTFAGVHEMSLLAGFTRQESSSESMGVEVRSFPNNNLRSLAAGFEERGIDGSETGWALLSQFGRLNYTYADKYNLIVSVRRDGSSRFGRNNRWGVFPSISANWIVTNEPFLTDQTVIPYLRLRASYGQVGSQDIPNFAQYATITPGQDYVFGVSPTLTPGATHLNVGNPNLKWEVTTQANVGLDLGLLDRRLSLEIDAYVKDTDDILLQLPVPTTSGIRRDNGPFVNAGSMRNKGVEVSATYADAALGGDFSYSIAANLAANRNEVTSLQGSLPIIATEANQGDGQQARTITQVGLPIGSFQGYVMEGVYRDQADVDSHATDLGAEPGDVKFADLNGDGIIDANDMTVIGNPFPDFTYGLNLDLAYRNFSALVLLHGKYGHEIYNLAWADLNESRGDNNVTIEMLDRWTPDNRDTNIPRAHFGDPINNTRPSTRFIEDGSFLRIQSIQLGYAIPDGVASRFAMSGVRLYVAARNLHTFTSYRGFNPEIGTLSTDERSSLMRGVDLAMYPIPRTLEAGVQLTLD